MVGTNSWQVWVMRGKTKMAESKMAKFKMAAIIKLEWEWMSLNQILVWVRVRVEWECFWVFLREDNKVFGSKWQWEPSSNWQKLSEVFFCAIDVTNLGKLSERGKTKMIESKMARIQDGRIQDGCHHQVKWEWMSLSQIELVWVRVRVEWECFWVNLREDNKVSESKMAVSESNMAEFKMAAIIKLSQKEWVKFFCANGGNQCWQLWVSLKGKTKMADSKMS